MRRRAQIDFGDVAFQDAIVHDQMFQRVQFLLPAAFRQLDHHPVIQDQVPAPLRDPFIGGDTGGDGAMGSTASTSSAAASGAPAPTSLGKLENFCVSWVVMTPPERSTTAIGLRLGVGRDLPKGEGSLFHHGDDNCVGIAAHHIRRGNPVQRKDTRPRRGRRSAKKMHWPGLQPQRREDGVGGHAAVAGDMDF